LTTSTSIALDSGRFSVALPDTCATAVKASPDAWAEVLVDGASLGRTKIGAVPYALEAGHATNADNATNATNATAAGTASAAGGALKTTIDGLAPKTSVPIVTGWTSYATALQDANNNAVISAAQTPTAVYRRVGDSIEVQIRVVLTGPAQASGAWFVAIPGGLGVADKSKLASISAVGFAEAYNAATQTTYLAHVWMGGSLTSLLMSVHGGAAITSSAPFSWTTGDEFVLRATVPIAGWTTTSP
jgi:hypothetical protein